MRMVGWEIEEYEYRIFVLSEDAVDRKLIFASE